MIIRSLQEALIRRGQATTDQLVFDLDTDYRMVGEALRFWVDRGSIRRVVSSVQGETCSTHCNGCPLSGACSVTTGQPDQGEMEIYEWIGSKN